MSSTTGKCLCGQVTVSITKEVWEAANNTVLCHCTNCRRSGGSLASYNIMAPEAAVKVTGEPKTYQDSDTDSGNTVQHTFCGNCGSPIYNVSPKMPGLRIVKLGLFDETLKPAIEIYCKARPSWIKAVDAAKQFNEMPTD